MELENKIVVITGGTGGIALSIIKELLSTYKVKYVAVLDLDLPECRKVFENLQNNYGEKVGFYPCDVTQTSMITENLDKVIASYGTIDILINNAGVGGESNPQRTIDINLKAVIVASYALIERIGKQNGGKGGLIVNIASTRALNNTRTPSYNASKHGVVSFTRTMKEYYELSGVRIVALCPGRTATPIFQKPVAIPDFLAKSGVRANAEHFIIQTPEHVAAAVIKIIQLGDCGDVWVSENKEPPYSVRSIEDYKSLKIKDFPA